MNASSTGILVVLQACFFMARAYSTVSDAKRPVLYDSVVLSFMFVVRGGGRARLCAPIYVILLSN